MNVDLINGNNYLENHFTKEDILLIYQEIIKEYNEIITNQTNINNVLSKFVVNGGNVGDEGRTIGLRDIDLPTDPAEYQNAIRIVTEDLENIRLVILKIKRLLIVLNRVEMDLDLANIVEDLESRLMELQLLEQSREQTVYELNAILNNINDQEFFGIGVGGDGGGGSSGGGGYYTTDNANGNDKIETGKGLKIGDTSRGNHKTLLEFSNLTDRTSIDQTEANLAQHEKDVANVLSKIVFDGEAVGAEEYGIAKAGSTDIDMDAGALYVGIDAVDADIKATQDLIDLIKKKIEKLRNEEIKEKNHKIYNEDILNL